MKTWTISTPSARYELVESEVVAGRYIGVTTTGGKVESEVLTRHEAGRWMQQRIAASWINDRGAGRVQPTAPMPAPALAPSPALEGIRRKAPKVRSLTQLPHPRGGIWASHRQPAPEDER